VSFYYEQIMLCLAYSVCVCVCVCVTLLERHRRVYIVCVVWRPVMVLTDWLSVGNLRMTCDLHQHQHD